MPNRTNQILTIPNILSFVRLGLIPVIVWLYCIELKYLWAGLVLLISGITDVVDGFIARRFKMMSNFGKIIDPIADKLTQVTVLLCLFLRFPLMILPIALLVIKEFFMTISGYFIIQNRNKVLGAQWHGKATTVCIFAMMMMHVFWIEIPSIVSNITIFICSGMITLSFVLYAIRNVREIRNK